MKKLRIHWLFLFATSLGFYCSILFFDSGTPAYWRWFMPSKMIGLFFLLWAARNLLARDWARFSAKRSKPPSR